MPALDKPLPPDCGHLLYVAPYFKLVSYISYKIKTELAHLVLFRVKNEFDKKHCE